MEGIIYNVITAAEIKKGYMHVSECFNLKIDIFSGRALFYSFQKGPHNTENWTNYSIK